MNIAVIDIGSNSIRMQISSVINGTFETIEDFKEMLRLGDDVFNLGYIQKRTENKLIKILTEIRAICIAKSATKIRAVATASFREASNADSVIERIKKETQIEIEIIDGKKEAYYGFKGVSANFDITNTKVLITDIGGGSAEFIVANHGKIELLESTPLGCNKLYKDYFKNDPPLEKELLLFKEDMRYRINKLPIDDTIEHIVCLGGTTNNISIIKNKDIQAKVKYTDRKFLKSFIRDISTKTVNERKKIKNLESKRADIMLSAALLIDAILDKTSRSGFYTLSGGLRTGLTLDTINNLGIVLDFQKNQSNLRLSRLIEIGKKFNFELNHAINVRNIALSIFNQLTTIHNLSTNCSYILEAAAILHDIGNYISYSKHHKHSYYLIMNSDFVGYSIDEVRLIAAIARYHRKGMPKDAHSEFSVLSEQDKDVVKKLAAILRIADALDRTHEGRIQSIDVKIEKQSVIFYPHNNSDILLEEKAFARKRDLFEKVFSLEAQIL